MAHPSPRIVLLVSATRQESERLQANGPRRDYLELARATNASLAFVEGDRRRKGVLGRLLGAHVRQAWQAASLARRGDSLFADGEHNGIPLALFLRLRRRRGVRVVMLGHFLSTRWKRWSLRIASRLGAPATVLVHSRVQQASAHSAVGARWHVKLVPYHVDARFWTDGAPGHQARPMLVSAGSENRDYETFIQAARAMPGVDVVIAAGSHWARQAATSGQHPLPNNVRFLTEPLDFAGLRDLYARATAVVVPLFDVENQSGVTTILEAMSMGLPVIVSATRGQQECVTGPLATGDGSLDWVATANRGPSMIGDVPVVPRAGEVPTGLYVPPADPAALAAAVQHIVGGSATRFDSGAIHDVARTCFDTSLFIGRLACELVAGSGSDVAPAAPVDHHHAAGCPRHHNSC